MMSKLFGVILGLLYTTALAEQFNGPTGDRPLRDVAFTTLNIGGGGQVDGINIPSTDVKFARTDAGGAYLWGTSDNKWHQIICRTCIPTNSTTGAQNFGYYPTTNTSTNQVYQSDHDGVEEIAGAPSNSSVAYLYFNGHILVSTNINPANPSAMTWTDTGFTRVSFTVANQNSYRYYGPIMSVDPFNADHVIAGSESNGLFETFNGTNSGGATWRTISTSSIPQAINHTNYRIAFDGTSGQTGTCHSGSGTCAKNAYIYTSGATAGVYATSNQGNNWALTRGGPSTVGWLVISYASIGGGTVWATDLSGNLWKYASGTWSEPLTGDNIQAATVDPNNGNHVVAEDFHDQLWVSTNGGSTFTRYIWTALTATDAPWLATIANTRGYLSAGGNITFDQNGNLYTPGGQAIWTTTLPGGNFTWTSQSVGIEELVMAGIAVGGRQMPTIGAQDEVGCTLSAITNTNPSVCNFLSVADTTNGLVSGYDFSIPPGSSAMFMKAGPDSGAGFDLSGYSTDGFVNSYTPLNNWSTAVPASALSNSSGVIEVDLSAATAGSTTTGALKTWAAGDSLKNNSIMCGLSTAVPLRAALTGVQTIIGAPGTCYRVSVIDSTHFALTGSTWNSALNKTGGNFIFWVPGQAFDNWLGAANVYHATNDGGLIQIRVMTFNGINNGNPVCITGVLGTTEANGCWIATNANTRNQTFDLQGSSFSHSYTGGGTATTWMAAGGSIAAASTTNLVVLGANQTAPLCTTNGGSSWSTVNVTGIPLVVTTVNNAGGYSAGAKSIVVANGRALSGSNQIEIPMSDGRNFVDYGFTVTSNTITLTKALPTGSSIADGANVYSLSGWNDLGFATIFNRPIAADKVIANKFYGVTDAGLVSWTNCGTPTIVNNTGRWFSATGVNELKAVPGFAGHVFYTGGGNNCGLGCTHPRSNQLWRSCNGGTTMTLVPGTYEPWAFGFGSIAPGKSYPSIYFIGWYSSDRNQNDAQYGIWRSIDDTSSGATCRNGTWQKVKNPDGSDAAFPGGWMSIPVDITGDPFVYGPLYLSTRYGAFWGVFTKETLAPEVRQHAIPAWCKGLTNPNKAICRTGR
jgi:hypothetical protein